MHHRLARAMSGYLCCKIKTGPDSELFSLKLKVEAYLSNAWKALEDFKKLEIKHLCFVHGF